MQFTNTLSTKNLPSAHTSALMSDKRRAEFNNLLASAIYDTALCKIIGSIEDSIIRCEYSAAINLKLDNTFRFNNSNYVTPMFNPFIDSSTQKLCFEVFNRLEQELRSLGYDINRSTLLTVDDGYHYFLIISWERFKAIAEAQHHVTCTGNFTEPYSRYKNHNEDIEAFPYRQYADVAKPPFTYANAETVTALPPLKTRKTTKSKKTNST